MTLEQIILIYQDIATRHMQINGFVVSEDYDLGTIDDRDFPLLAIVPMTGSLPKTLNGFSSFDMDFEIKILDLVDSALHNQIHVYSDAIEILKDVVNEIETHPYYHQNGIVINNDVEFSKLDEFTDGELFGYGTSITITTPNKLSYCGSPLTEITGFNAGGVAGENDVTIVNTTGSFSIIGVAGTTVTLNDEVIEIRNEDMSLVSTQNNPLYENVQIDVELIGEAPKDGIQYKRPRGTGITTSYALYDDGWQRANGGYDYPRPSNPDYAQDLDYDADPTGNTLLHDNAFGNKIRFTDEAGVASLDVQNIYVVDNLTGLGHYVTAHADNKGTFAELFGAGGKLETLNASNIRGYNDYFAASQSILEGLIDIEGVHNANQWILPYRRVSKDHVISSTPWASSNTGAHIVTHYMHWSIGSNYNTALAVARHMLMTRIHF